MEKNNNNEIVPGKGYGNFMFGMAYSEVVELLGDPEEILNNDENDNNEFANSLTVFFDDHGLAMFFEEIEKKGQMKLQSIEIDEPSATMFGKNIFGMEKKQLIRFTEEQLKEKGVSDTDDELEGFELIDFEKNGVSLQLEDDELISVTIYNL